MSHQQQTPVMAYPAVGQTNLATPPPPVGYPSKDELPAQQTLPIKTTTRGDGFWKGCCAGLCCCCALDCCL